jgi:hypothetical protein
LANDAEENPMSLKASVGVALIMLVIAGCGATTARWSPERRQAFITSCERASHSPEADEHITAEVRAVCECEASQREAKEPVTEAQEAALTARCNASIQRREGR